MRRPAPAAIGAALPLAVTMGEPAGIGGEIALAAWALRRRTLPPFLMIDDPARLAALAHRIGLDVPIEPVDGPEDAAAIFLDRLPVMPLPLPAVPVPGRIDPRNGPAVIAAIERAVALVRSGRAAAVVTNPINKRALYDCGFRFPGHTEFLASLAGGDAHPVMMLASERVEGGAFRVVPVTVHQPLAEAARTLSTDLIVRTGRIVARALRELEGIAAPRLAVAGLNPHAGEAGALGSEDGAVIAPAVAQLQADGIAARGPLPADTMFHADARATYDAALGMYHDQALIPLKTLDFHGGVNATLGLPFVRTSPDHGTALDIAGKGVARSDSLEAALLMAARMAANLARAAMRAETRDGQPIVAHG
ncbi:MAG: 4-hydroxythreonine-4-phosphate dehydrogenase PdxA [Alphaproteobacteria bacterium]|nr:4-hydroxythreonine-4-phosphate dehydrogenase PdxA [Alphaproteobacteria bacterium]